MTIGDPPARANRRLPGDPLQFFSMTTDGYARIAAASVGHGLPLAVARKSGYVSDALDPSLTSFLSAVGETHG